jgi:hypothetical protein
MQCDSLLPLGGRLRAMWPRETTARSGDIEGGIGSPRQSQCLRVLQRSTAVCVAAKNPKSLAARAGVCGAGGPPTPGTNMMCNGTGHVLLRDVAARDVQAATSPASRIARAGRKSWRFAGDGSGARGKAGAAKAKSFDGFPCRKPAVSNSPPDVTARNHGSQRRHRCGIGVAKGKAKVSRF